MLVSIDPGLRHCGVAVFSDSGELQKTYLIRNKEKTERGPKVWKSMAQEVRLGVPGTFSTLVIEVPQVYSARFAKGNPADLIELAGVDGALSICLPADEVFGYLPRVWKGQVPKDIHNQRIEKTLTSAERTCVIELSATLRHNVWDAVGIGLYHLKRMK